MADQEEIRIVLTEEGGSSSPSGGGGGGSVGGGAGGTDDARPGLFRQLLGAGVGKASPTAGGMIQQGESIGGAAKSIGKAGAALIVIQVFAETVNAAIEAFKKLNDEAKRLAESIQGISPEVSQANALARVRELEMKIERSEKVGSQLAESTDLDSQIAMAMERIDTNLSRVLVPVLNSVKELVVDLLNYVNMILEWLLGDNPDEEKKQNLRDIIFTAFNNSEFAKKLNSLETLEDINAFLTNTFRKRTGFRTNLQEEIADFLQPGPFNLAGVQQPENRQRGVFGD